MKVKVRLKPSLLKFVKKDGMHLLNNFIPNNEDVVIELAKDEEFILESKEFIHWFDLLDQGKNEKLDLTCTRNEDDTVEFVATDNHTIKQLRSWAKSQGFECTHLSKPDLIEAINEGTLNKK